MSSEGSASPIELAAICLDLGRSDIRGPWLRATPIVLRQALEIAVTAALADHGVGEGASMRAKLLCLTEVVGPDVGTEAIWLWERLSEGCHYGAYRLDATLDELTEWNRRTADLCATLG